MNFNVKEVVSSILFEESEKSKGETPPPEKETSSKEKKESSYRAGLEASTGAGRYVAGVKEAGALAEEDPNQLMNNLGIKITPVSGADDLEKITKILRQAFTGAEAMRKVYTGLSTVKKGEKSGLKVNVSEIKANSGVKYLYHTLVGAENSGVLNLDSKMQIENVGGTVIIYQGEKKTWDK